MRQFPKTFMKTIYSNFDVSNNVFGRQEDKNCHSQEVATHLTISYQINNSKFWPIKGGICHAFRHLSFQIKIKIMFLLSFFIFL
jgi:hypothetical protein